MELLLQQELIGMQVVLDKKMIDLQKCEGDEK